jgi:hypothetical protein
MANSYRTAPAILQARVNHIRDKYGATLLPHIVVHKPRRGDIYHLDKRLLTAVWRWIPIAYRHGLKVIELKARTNDFVGHPYAYHHIRTKSICIYSCPPLDWPVTSTDPNACGNYKTFGATVQTRSGTQFIRHKALGE